MTRAAVGGVNRGTWTPQEDMLLKKYIEANGVGSWSTLPQKAGLMRGGKSCRLRWMNHLRPNVKRGHISSEEEDLIIRLHNLLGNRWSLIAGRVPGRTDNDVKNYWNTHLRKKLATNDFAQCKTVKRIFEGHPLSCRDPKNIRAEDQKLNSRSKNQAKINTAVPDNFCFASPTDSVAIPLHLRKEYSGDLSDSQLQDGTVKFDVTEASSSKFEKRDPAILEDDYKFGRDRVEKDESHERIAPSVIQMNELTEDMAEFLPITQFEQNVSTVFCSDSFISSRAGFDNLFWENDFIWEGLH